MHIGIAPLCQAGAPFTLIVSAGFEPRAPRAAYLIHEARLRPERVIVLTYERDKDSKSHKSIMAICEKLAPSDRRAEVRVEALEELERLLAEVPLDERVVCDITGLSRMAMYRVLTLLARRATPFWVIYTEADEYYPRKRDFKALLSKDRSEAFLNLINYEHADVIYSGKCRVEDIPGFEGRHLPNYPLLLIAFLTYKRSRLGAIIREYEANLTFLVKAVPVRPDLKWRDRAMEIVNFDLIEDHKNSIIPAETLNWRTTLDLLERIYETDHANYRYNILLAPLGSKMQTVGAWAFAFRHPEVRVVTSTPTVMYREKYSTGWRDTFLIDDLSTAFAD
jgi:hypothetical protein